MGKTSENIYSLLVARGFHDRMEDCEVPYNVVGGLGLHAVPTLPKLIGTITLFICLAACAYRVYAKMVRCETLIH